MNFVYTVRPCENFVKPIFFGRMQFLEDIIMKKLFLAGVFLKGEARFIDAPARPFYHEMTSCPVSVTST